LSLFILFFSLKLLGAFSSQHNMQTNFPIFLGFFLRSMVACF